MKKILLLFLCVISAFAYSKDEIVNAILEISAKNAIEAEILYTIVKIESKFDPFAISLLTSEDEARIFGNFNDENITINMQKYKFNQQKWLVSLYPKNEEMAKFFAKKLIDLGYNIDVGLGQINSINFKQSEIDEIFKPTYNLQIAAKVLRHCYKNKNQDIKKTIECYNYGVRNRLSYPYFNKFIKIYEGF